MRCHEFACTVGVFVAVLELPAWAQVTQRVSLGSGAVQANWDSYRSSISADGRYVAFASGANNLVAADTNGVADIFVRDRLNGTTERVSVSSAGAQSNGGGSDPSISPDGRFVVFESWASDLAPDDTNSVRDIYVRDRQSGTTVRASVASDGAQGSQHSFHGSISAEGRFVAFDTYSALVPGDTNLSEDVFVRDLVNGTTERVSLRQNGTQAVGHSTDPSISGDGRYVAFTSQDAWLVLPTNSDGINVYVRDRLNGTNERISVDANGLNWAAPSGAPEISADGRFVAFASSAANFVPGDTNNQTDIFVRDRQLLVTDRASIASNGTQSNATCSEHSISADGRYVAFLSAATTLVSGDTNGQPDTFVHDRQTGTTERVNVDYAGAQADTPCFSPAMSGDGRYVVFDIAAQLVPDDTDGWADIFVRDRTGGTDFTSLCDPGSAGVPACPCSNAPSGQGRGCNNSASTGGAVLSARGGAFLSSDSLVLTTSGEKPTALSTVWQGSGTLAAGVVFGQGVRCANGALKRLYNKSAIGGSITAPNFGAGDPTVSARSAAKGNLILAGQVRYYFVSYRDPIVLGGCPAASTFNATQTARVTWAP